MTVEELIITGFRLFGALLVLRWALFGSVAAIAIDLSDLFLMNLLDLGSVRNYQALDKWLDLSYMFSFGWVAFHWKGGPKNLALALLCYRIVGVGFFEITNDRTVLLWFPNFFEFWFILYAALIHFKPVEELKSRTLIICFIPLALLKGLQEYVLHVAKWLDQYKAVDLVKDWWAWFFRLA